MSIRKADIAKYTLLPGLLPRIFALLTSGFSHTAYLIALIYHALRLLPAHHPYLNSENMGRFGIRHVIAEAANNLVISRQNIDQVFIFFVILIGLVLLFAQFALLGLAIIAQPAFAAADLDLLSTLTVSNILRVDSVFSPGADHPAQDLAFIIFDRVFGIQGVFNSCVSDIAIECKDLRGNPVSSPAMYPMPFHTALHSLLRFYSMGIFVVSVFVIIYFIISITAETAATGTPFGQRFNKTWAPVRLILFFALLVPLNIGKENAGLNGAQMITFWTAKTGSNFATNAWGRFNGVLTESYTASGGGGTYLGEEETLIATPNIPKFDTLIQAVFTSMVCKIATETAYVNQAKQTGRDNSIAANGINYYLVRQKEDNVLSPGLNYREFISTDYKDARLFSNNGTITVVIGTPSPDDPKSQDYLGGVIPHCGEIQIQVSSVDKAGAAQSGADAMQAMYYENILRNMAKDPVMYQHAECIVRRTYQKNMDQGCTALPDKDFANTKIEYYKKAIRDNLQPIIDQQVANGDWAVNDNLKSKGWAGASLWYNRIAEMNGDISNAVANVPSVLKYPMLLEFVKLKKGAASESISGRSMFDPVLDNGKEIKFKNDADAQIAPAMYAGFKIWQDQDDLTENFFIKAINWLFGTSGIFEMRRNADIHPLAQLSALGKSMMEASIRNLAVGIPLSFLEGKVEDPFLSALGIGGSFAKTIGTTTLAMSFVLYYILPFLPFIYFIFAVSGWIKSIFEAIVAMPLWALAHVSRIDGEGLPGPAATNGYFLLLEIFLRPILILFGLIASIVVFSALVKVLNDGVFELVVSNLGGYDREADAAGGTIQELTDFIRGPVDEFFFTALYVIIVYMMGLSSFKLIDLIPNDILRWAGVTVSTFQEGAGDPAGQVIQKTYSGALLATNQVKGGALAAL